MRDTNSIQKLCRICLNQGSRDIYENNFMSRNIVSTNDIELDRIVEKLRFVTLLKVNPKENLPQQICDLCIVQLNVSYNFKRLALKNDFHIRQYMIENGMNIMKEDDDMENNMVEIHQIHNVIRTTNLRPLIAPPPPPPPIQSNTQSTFSEMRRNSTTSSVSGISGMILTSTATNGNSSNQNENAPSTKPFNVRPIQIKIEPNDPEYEDMTMTNGKQSQTVQSSPSNSSGSLSILTVDSSNSGASNTSKTPPMIVINGKLPYKNSTSKSPVKSITKTVEVTARSPTRRAAQKQQQSQKENDKKLINTKRNDKEKPRNAVRDLRTIIKPPKALETQRKLRAAVVREMEKRKEEKMKKNQSKKKKEVGGKKLGRPLKYPQKKNDKTSLKNIKNLNKKKVATGKRKK